MAGWNPWHGCTKLSEGCAHCYVYRMDEAFARDASAVRKTAEYDLPRRRKRDGGFAIEPGQDVWTCLSSDFFLDKADPWRMHAWETMRLRGDLRFHIITKRILRAGQCLPDDWGEGYRNVRIGCTAENQRRACERLDAFVNMPIAARFVVCEPLLGPVDISAWLKSGAIEQVIAGGESGDGARECRYEWVIALREQCREAGVAFHFKQTGANFVKDGRRYRIARQDQAGQARRAGLDIAAGFAKEAWEPGENQLCKATQLSIL